MAATHWAEGVNLGPDWCGLHYSCASAFTVERAAALRLLLGHGGWRPAYRRRAARLYSP